MMTYPEGYTVTTLRYVSPPRRLRLSKPQKPRTKKAKGQAVGGNPPYMRTSNIGR